MTNQTKMTPRQILEMERTLLLQSLRLELSKSRSFNKKMGIK